MYAAYHLGVNARPSDLHGGRAKDKDGNWIGFASERRYSENCMAVIEKDGGEVRWSLIPLDLDLRRENPLRRGLPEVASPEVGRHIADYLTEVSRKYQTALEYTPDGRIVAR